MLTGELDAASAAFEVGYESPSQFNRERSRLLGSNGCGITGLVHRGDGSRKAVGILSSLPTGETVVSVYGYSTKQSLQGQQPSKQPPNNFGLSLKRGQIRISSLFSLVPGGGSNPHEVALGGF
jgi:hypothetical protein